MRTSRVGAVLVLVCIAVALCAGFVSTSGCSGSGSPAGTDDDDPPTVGDTIYVDPAFAGEEHGTRDNPFDTIGEALDIAGHGDRIVLAAGSYDDQNDIEVGHAVEIVGAGRTLTTFGVGFALAADTSASPVLVESLACASVYTLQDTSAASRCAYEVRGCLLDGLADSVALVDSLHYRLVEDCEIAGDVYLGGGAVKADCAIRDCGIGGGVRLVGIAARGDLALEGCTIGGDAEVWSVAAYTEQRAEDCDVAGSLSLLSTLSRGTRAVGNTVGGDSLTVSGVSVDTAYVSDNVVTDGDLFVRGRSIAAEITGNTVSDGTLRFHGRSASVGIHDNAVTRSTVGTGIHVYAVALSRPVMGNTVTVPYAAWSGIDAPHDTLSAAAIFVDGTSIQGVRGNEISGGAYGIYVRGLAIGAVSDNAVSDSETGIAVISVSAPVDSNAVHDCVGDGVALYAHPEVTPDQTWLPLEANTVADNGGAGVRVCTRTSLGLGSGRARALGAVRPTGASVLPRGWYRSDGGNVLIGNADYDLAVELLAADCDTLFARGNTWDHADSLSIGIEDIYDKQDDPTRAKALYWPATRRH